YPEGAVQIMVEDSGIGIPEDRQDAIFGQFYQAHSPERNHSRSVSGSGIGLALSDGLVKLHGGVITVVSNLRNEAADLREINTRFTVFLPMGKDHFGQQVLFDAEEP